jgi:hypothetical protein
LKPSFNIEHDDFDKIIEIMKTKSVTALKNQYGTPDEIKVPEQDLAFKIWTYKNERIDAYIKSSDEKRISHMTLFFFENFDNYSYLKKRFKNFSWIETKLPDDKSGHVMTDRYQVRVPEINMTFEYDQLSPKRKVMWINFE